MMHAYRGVVYRHVFAEVSYENAIFTDFKIFLRFYFVFCLNNFAWITRVVFGVLSGSTLAKNALKLLMH